MMVLVLRQAVGAESMTRTIKAVHIAFALVRVAMDLAVVEEAGPQERLQPRGAELLTVTHSIDHWPNLKQETNKLKKPIKLRKILKIKKKINTLP